MPDFGIGEALAAFAPELFAGVADAAPALETGLATIGTGVGDVAAGTGSLADIVGSGTGLFGSTTGLLGTAAPEGLATADGIAGLLGTAGPTALGTAGSYLAAPAASGFNEAAVTASPGIFSSGTTTPSIGAPGSGPGTLNGITPSPSPTGAPGTSVFDTGTSGVTGVSGTGSPAAITPAGASASSVSAPSGLSGVADPTASATAGTAGQAGQAAGSSSITDLLKNSGSSAIKSLTSNPLGTALGAAGLGYNIYSGQKQNANQAALTADAQAATANSNKLASSGEALQQYLTNGTLPPAYQQQVDQAIADAKTRAISNAAAQGQPTDPTQNTTLAQTLAGIDNQRAAMQTQVASQLFSSGTSLVSAGQSAAGLSGSLYQSLVQNDTTSAANTGKAIATLAAALNGKSSNNLGNVNISTG
jgi:hypothetical protein